MNKPTIEALTWAATLTGAVISACSLAAGDATLPDPRLQLLSAGPAHVPQAVATAPRRSREAAPQRPRRSPSQPVRSESWRGAAALA